MAIPDFDALVEMPRHGASELGLGLVITQVHGAGDVRVVHSGAGVNLDKHLKLLVDGVLVVLPVVAHFSHPVGETDGAHDRVHLDGCVSALLELDAGVVDDARLGAIVGIEGRMPLLDFSASPFSTERNLSVLMLMFSIILPLFV